MNLFSFYWMTPMLVDGKAILSFMQLKKQFDLQQNPWPNNQHPWRYLTLLLLQIPLYHHLKMEWQLLLMHHWMQAMVTLSTQINSSKRSYGKQKHWKQNIIMHLCINWNMPSPFYWCYRQNCISFLLPSEAGCCKKYHQQIISHSLNAIKAPICNVHLIYILQLVNH